MAVPKFTLRDLFWLVVVISMGMGWFVDRSRLAVQIIALTPVSELIDCYQEQKRLRNRIAQLEGRQSSDD